jgi:hypothetical protein
MTQHDPTRASDNQLDRIEQLLRLLARQAAEQKQAMAAVLRLLRQEVGT